MVFVTIIAMGMFDSCPDGCSNWLEVVEAGTAKGVLYGTAIISLMEVTRIMVILPSDYLTHKFIEPLKQSLRDEGRAEMHARIVDWMRRKEEAEREGRKFDDPMPGPGRNGRKAKQ